MQKSKGWRRNWKEKSVSCSHLGHFVCHCRVNFTLSKRENSLKFSERKQGMGKEGRTKRKEEGREGGNSSVESHQN